MHPPPVGAPLDVTELSLNGRGEGLTVPPADFWRTRPVLTHLRNYALARLVSPWAVLGVALVRVVTATPPRVVLPPIIGGYGSLNLFVGLVGPPGSGKGGATTAAREAMHYGTGTHSFATHKLGTGQGISHSYGRREKNGDLTRHTESVMFIAEEIDAMSATARQVGSNLLPELRSLYMGERLGAMYADTTRRIEIDEGTYRAGLIAHIQPARAGALIDDTDGGTPQRFLWMPTTHPHGDTRPALPELPWYWRAPDWPNPGQEKYPKPVVMPVPDEVKAAVIESAVTRARGIGDPLDGHHLFCKEKAAAALALLDGRGEITLDDWELAATVMAVSDTVRGGVLEVLAETKRKAHQDKATVAAIQAITVDEALTERAIARVARKVLARIPPYPEWIFRKPLRDKIVSRDRQYVDDAITHLYRAGQVIFERTARGVRYQRTTDD